MKTGSFALRGRSIWGLTTAFSLIVLAQEPARSVGLTFSGISSGQWSLPVTPTASTHLSNQAGGKNNRLEWGHTQDCPDCTPFNNYVQFNSSAFDISENTLFKVGDLIYRNGSTLDSFNGDFSLTVALLLDVPVKEPQTFSFLFNIFNTENLTRDPVLDGDRLRFSTAGLSSQVFTYSGIDYTLQLVGFSADGGDNILSEFNSPEGSVARAALFGMITSHPKPAPATCPY